MTGKYKLGMVSVTYRNYSVDEVIAAVKDAGLDGIEWGGDVHVPHGDIERAEYTKNAMEKSGLETFSYGSYYRALESDDFDAVMASALALGAPNIRIWAGKWESHEADEEKRAAITADIKRVCRLAAQKGLTVSAEYHGWTLTDNYDSAVRLFNDVNEENFRLYWQPNQFYEFEENVSVISKLLPMVSNIHVFSWERENRFPLRYHAERWQKYIDIIDSSEKTRALIIEFVHDESREALIDDADFLKKVVMK